MKQRISWLVALMVLTGAGYWAWQAFGSKTALGSSVSGGQMRSAAALAAVEIRVAVASLPFGSFGPERRR